MLNTNESDILILTKEEITSACRPCVYVVFGERDPQYIGVSELGLTRVFTRSAGSVKANKRRNNAFNLCKIVKIEFFSSYEGARKRETELIHTFHPPYNSQCSECKFYSYEGRKK